jgi:hypothetical protein
MSLPSPTAQPPMGVRTERGYLSAAFRPHPFVIAAHCSPKRLARQYVHRPKQLFADPVAALSCVVSNLHDRCSPSRSHQ